MTQINEAVNRTIVRVLEDWAMMMLDPLESSPRLYAGDDAVYMGSAEFHGPVNGRYFVICKLPFMTALAANLLGAEETPGDEDCSDALREMVNVLSGNLLTESYGVDCAFKLTAPLVQQVKPVELEELFKRPVFSFAADGEPVSIGFALEV